MPRMVGAALLPLILVAPSRAALVQRRQHDERIVTDASQSPVMKVIPMVVQLKDTVTMDFRQEQQEYDQYACWCEATLERKAKSISEAKETIERLNEAIPKAGAEVATHNVEIKQLKKEIAENEAAREEATKVRDNEAATYRGEKTESENCMGALEAAVRTLSGAGEKKKAFLDTMHEAQLLSVVADVRRVLQKDITADRASEQDLQVLRHFVESPALGSSSMQGSSVLQLSQSNNPFGDYAPQSTQIQGILKGMYDSFAAELEKDNAEEAEKQKSYEELMETKKQEHETLVATLKQQEEDRAKKVKLLADGKTERDDTEEQLKADEEFFATTKKGCQQKAEDWSLRSSLRTEELMGINKALDILRDPDNTKLFNSAATTLVQLSATSSSRGGARLSSKLYARLSNLAAQYDSLRLGRLAVQVKLNGHFDKVMSAIDQMIEELRKEEQEDIEHRDRCEGGADKNKNDIEDLNHNIKKAGTEIARLEGNIADLKVEVDTHRSSIKDAEKEMKEMLNMRNEENAAFVRALRDDANAIKIVKSAIAALSKFYESKRLDSPSLVQKQAPEYSRDPDKAPETTWDKPDYEGEKGQTTGVLGALEMIVEDMENEMKTGRKEEADAQAQYEEDRDNLRKVVKSLQLKKNDAEMRAAELGEKRDETEEMKTQLNSELGEQQDLLKNLKRDCSWVKTYFKSRQKARKAEMDGLQEAKSLLSGADAGDYDALAIDEASK